MHGGSKTPLQRQRRRSWGEGTLLAAGPREARSYCLKITADAAPRLVATPPVPATDTEHSEPGGAGVTGRGALSGGITQGARGAGAEPSGAIGCAGSNPSGSYHIFGTSRSPSALFLY